MGILSGFKMPKISMPSINLSDLGMPDLNSINIDFSKIKPSDFGIPDLKKVKLDVGSLATKVGLPDISSITSGKFDLSGIKLGLDLGSLKNSNIFSLDSIVKNADIESVLKSHFNFDINSAIGNIGLDSLTSKLGISNIDSVMKDGPLGGIMDKVKKYVDVPDPESMMSKFGISVPDFDIDSVLSQTGLGDIRNNSLLKDMNIPDVNSIMPDISMPSFDLGF